MTQGKVTRLTTLGYHVSVRMNEKSNDKDNAISFKLKK